MAHSLCLGQTPICCAAQQCCSTCHVLLELLLLLLCRQVKKDYAEFYRSSMLYLAFISSDSLGYDFKLPLAVDVSLAALLGEGIYNFAQLLMHPIVKVRI
jgi:hypothetical protein